MKLLGKGKLMCYGAVCAMSAESSCVQNAARNETLAPKNSWTVFREDSQMTLKRTTLFVPVKKLYEFGVLRQNS